MHAPVRTTSLAALFFLAGAGTTHAQLPIGREMRIAVPAQPPYSSGPSRVTALLPDGGFVVAWTKAAPSPASEEIAVRRFNAAGIAVGAELLVNSFTTGDQHNPAITSDPAGNFIVVWTSDGQDGSGPGVFGQKFDASGARVGAEFRATETTLGRQESPSVSASGSEFVVVWISVPDDEVFARRFDSAGAPVGGEFQVNIYTTGAASYPSVAHDGTGDFVVAWNSFYNIGHARLGARLYGSNGTPQTPELVVHSNTAGFPITGTRVARGTSGPFVITWRDLEALDGGNILARRFDAGGAPVGGPFLVNTFTTGPQRNPDVAVDLDGDFVIVWDTYVGDGSGIGVFGRRFSAGGAGGPEFRVNTYTTSHQFYASVGGDRAGNFVVTWHTAVGGGQGFGAAAQRFAGGMMGLELAVDSSAGPASDGNRVLEAGETVAVAPTWLNANFTPQTVSGAVSSFTGPGAPGDPTYAITDASATYGTVSNGGLGTCTADCYVLGITTPTTRPAAHWDATVREQLAPANLGAEKLWTLHVGDSFSDVPRSNGFYRFVETLLHHGVTGGCAASAYCPSASTTREEMAVFVLVANEGAGYVPPACVSPPFADVPVGSPFCPWIAELARRGVVNGCGGSNYCPTAPVAREEMAVFVLATWEPGFTPPACGTPVFNDVPAFSPFCRWIEELARRGVVTGCGGGAYCPTAPVTREQMAVFLTGTFRLLLYGP